MNKNYKESLIYHKKFPSGKISIKPTKKYNNPKYLSLAYSPGVAAPCLEIYKNKYKSYDYTSKNNLVGVITNGTAVLGLGNIGALASKPVMEGKCILFKIFAGIDAFDIEINEKNTKKIINIIKSISIGFGGINLEDIKSPEAFKIEKKLIKKIKIPIMHDDQHGTSIVSSAALINSLELVNKDINNIKIIVCGAGSAAISCVKMYIKLGALKKNIFIYDSIGLIYKNRNTLNKEKKKLTIHNNDIPMDISIKDADVFIGLSKQDLLTPKMLNSMSRDPIIFAMSNPNPEINYELANKTRKDIIIATGRSDYPNQVNNVICFPFIFRGALDVRSKCINNSMKMAAIMAISKLAKKNVTNKIKKIYNNNDMKFNKNYIIPKPLDRRLLYSVSTEVAKAAIKSNVHRKNINNWKKYKTILKKRMK